MIVFGLNSLHRHGYITQRPFIVEVACLPGEPAPELIKEMRVHRYKKKLSWFKLINDHLEPCSDRYDDDTDLMMLRPEWALADILEDDDHWCPDPDDVDGDAIEDMEEFHRACEALGTDQKVVDKYMAKYGRELL